MARCLCDKAPRVELAEKSDLLTLLGLLGSVSFAEEFEGDGFRVCGGVYQ